MAATRVQGQRDMGLSVLNLRGLAINDASNNTNSVTVYASDSGIMFINEFVGTTTYTLPAVADCAGKVFFFYDNVGETLIVTAPSGSFDLMSGGETTAKIDADKVTSGGTQGEWSTIIGDGTNYFCLAGEGTWTASG